MWNKQNETNTFTQKVAKYIQSHHLLHTNHKYLVALSGGADSVALLRTLLLLGYKVEATHCNFHLRGEESDRDEEFCKRLCNDLCVALHIVHFDTNAYAALHHQSIELAARNLRYSYFHSLCRDISAKGICVAHHRDDNVETVLMNLLRGTGIHGLRGILPRNGEILRPLLGVSRKEIENFLGYLDQPFVTDRTNLIDEATRNKIRLNVLPLLETINPNVSETIDQVSENIKEACKVFDSAIDKSINEVFSGGKISISKLMSQPSPEYTLFTILNDYGFSSVQTKEIFNKLSSPSLQSGKIWNSETHSILVDRGQLVLEEYSSDTISELKIPEEGNYVIKGGDGKISIKSEPIDEDFVLSRDKDCICIDAQMVSFPLHLRLTAEGDRFVPFGMRNFKLVSDFLTDRKKNLFEKRRQLVLTNSDNNIIWLVGERIDNRFRITSTTERVLRISLL